MKLKNLFITLGICMSLFQTSYAINAKITIYNKTNYLITAVITRSLGTQIKKDIEPNNHAKMTAKVGKLVRIRWVQKPVRNVSSSHSTYKAPLEFHKGSRNIYIYTEGKYKYQKRIFIAEKLS